jgi:hypothetical protein
VDPGDNDEAVVGDLAGLDAEDAGVHDAPVQVEAGDLGQVYPDVLCLRTMWRRAGEIWPGGIKPVATW